MSQLRTIAAAVAIALSLGFAVKNADEKDWRVGLTGFIGAAVCAYLAIYLLRR